MTQGSPADSSATQTFLRLHERPERHGREAGSQRSPAELTARHVLSPLVELNTQSAAGPQSTDATQRSPSAAMTRHVGAMGSKETHRARGSSHAGDSMRQKPFCAPWIGHLPPSHGRPDAQPIVVLQTSPSATLVLQIPSVVHSSPASQREPERRHQPLSCPSGAQVPSEPLSLVQRRLLAHEPTCNEQVSRTAAGGRHSCCLLVKFEMQKSPRSQVFGKALLQEVPKVPLRTQRDVPLASTTH
jgi:hypothetical protein